MFDEIQKANREGDKSKVKTIGPFCKVLGQIIQFTAENRQDIQPVSEENPMTLYRAGFLPLSDVEKLKEKMNENLDVKLWGHTSTTQDLSQAINHTKLFDSLN